MNAPVIFRCTSCDYYNRLELGIPGFVERQTEFDSFSDAWAHMRDNDHHHIEAHALILDQSTGTERE